VIYCTLTPKRLPIDVCPCDLCKARRKLAEILVKLEQKP
jgi:hypothetical protein